MDLLKDGVVFPAADAEFHAVHPRGLLPAMSEMRAAAPEQRRGSQQHGGNNNNNNHYNYYNNYSNVVQRVVNTPSPPNRLIDECRCGEIWLIIA